MPLSCIKKFLFFLCLIRVLRRLKNTVGFSLAHFLDNALALSLQSRGLKTKNLLKQAWQIFLCSSLVAPGRFIVETPRIELGSKQAAQMLSTYVVFV